MKSSLWIEDPLWCSDVVTKARSWEIIHPHSVELTSCGCHVYKTTRTTDAELVSLSVCETMKDYKEGYLMVWTNSMSPCSSIVGLYFKGTCDVISVTMATNKVHKGVL